MRVSNRFDGSICAAILSARPAVAASGIQPCRGGFARSNHRPPATRPSSSRNVRLENASACVNTPTWLRSTFLPGLPIHTSPSAHRRLNTTSRATLEARPSAVIPPSTPPPQGLPTSPPSKDHLLSLVSQQDAGPVDEYLQFYRDPYLRRFAEPDGPNLMVSNGKDEENYPSRQDAVHGDEEIERVVNELGTAVRTRLRHPARVNLDNLYRIYTKLPEPRMLHMSAVLRRAFLRALGTPERKDSKSMLRYFSAINDVKNCGLSLRLQEYNHALSYASRYVRKTTEIEAEATLKLWSEMEREAGIRGNEVTFNILFDVASKAGNFALAEMIYKEMEAREIRFNRYHHVSLIHYFGLKMDGDGVRAAYREMVEAGEMVDTVVLNCVIVGFLRSGEESAAEEVYEKMKASTRDVARPNLPERDYGTNKIISKILMMFGKLGRRHPPMREALQRCTPLTPDIHTYRVLVNHYAVKIGDISKVAKYLDEMKWFDIPLHGSIFLALFRGFFVHGGFQDASWSVERLRSVFSALLDALEGRAAGTVYVEVWLAMWVLRAFKKCTTADETAEVYHALRGHMNLAESQEMFMEDFLRDLLNNQDALMYKSKPWSGMLNRGRA